MSIFRRNEITLNRVHDTVRVREGKEVLTLHVDGDAMRMVAGLNAAQKQLQGLQEGSTDNETREAARYFASVIFGGLQAGELMNFYRNDAACVVNVCGRYFSQRLSKLIEKAQKRK